MEIALPQDPGQAGKAQAHALVRPSKASRPRHARERRQGHPLRAVPAQAEAGNVYVLRGAWNEAWFAALESFPTAPHDDDADATSRAFAAHQTRMASAGFLELAREDLAGRLSSRGEGGA